MKTVDIPWPDIHYTVVEDGSDMGNVHVCGPSTMTRLTTALLRLYEACDEHMVHWNGD